MDDQLTERVLAAHADALNQGIDNSKWLMTQFCHRDTADCHDLESLLTVANQLKLVLVPIEVDEQFAYSLGEMLVADGSSGQVASVSEESLAQTNSWWLAAAVGTFAAGFFVWRLIQSDEHVISPSS